MRRFLLALVLLTGCDEPFAPPVDGVYSLCDEVSGFSGEMLELRDGQFRYWFYSDVVTGHEPAYPLTGSYAISGSTLTLGHSDIYSNNRTLAVVNGVPVIWRDDGMSAWNQTHEINAYGVLIKVTGVLEASPHLKRPSIALIKSPDVKKAEQKRFEDRYNDRPAEVRALLRARSMRGEPDRDTYHREIDKVRVHPDATLLGQLVALLGGGSGLQVDAQMMLGDIFTKGYSFPEEPAFLKDPVTRKQGLEALTDALSKARDRSALEETMMTFLRASKVSAIDLDIPEAKVRVKLQPYPDMGGRYASDSGLEVDSNWANVMPKLIPACQKWMRDQLPK